MRSSRVYFYFGLLQQWWHPPGGVPPSSTLPDPKASTQQGSILPSPQITAEGWKHEIGVYWLWYLPVIGQKCYKDLKSMANSFSSFFPLCACPKNCLALCWGHLCPSRPAGPSLAPLSARKPYLISRLKLWHDTFQMFNSCFLHIN